MNDFYANQYSNQATENDDLADADHLYDTAEAAGQRNDSQSESLLSAWKPQTTADHLRTVYIQNGHRLKRPQNDTK